MISRLELAEIIGERTLHVQSYEELKNAVAAYLLAENSSKMLDSLMRDVLAYRAAHGFIEATVVSANPLTGTTRSDVEALIREEYPNAQQISIDEVVDTAVVGGLRIELAGKELDLTVKAKLNIFKRLTAARKD